MHCDNKIIIIIIIIISRTDTAGHTKTSDLNLSV